MILGDDELALMTAGGCCFILFLQQTAHVIRHAFL